MTKQTTIVVTGSLRGNMFILQTQFRCFISVFSDKSPSKDELTAGKAYVPLLDWKTAQQKVSWGVLLLMGGGFALAEGCAVRELYHHSYTNEHLLLSVRVIRRQIDVRGGWGRGKGVEVGEVGEVKIFQNVVC